MNPHMIGQNRVPNVMQTEAVFMDSHGDDTIKSVSMGTTNAAGNPYIEVPEGTVLAWNHGRQRWMPMAADTAQADTSSANTVVVDNSHQFIIGDRINIAGVGYRTITAIDDDTKTITFDGAAASLTAGDNIVQEAFRGFSTVDGTSGASTSVVLADATPFKVGDTITIGADADIEITAIDYGTNTITIASTTVADGELVFTQNESSAHFRLMCETVRASNLERGYTSANVFAPTRAVGEVRERVVRGLTAAAKTYLEGRGIRFNATAY